MNEIKPLLTLTDAAANRVKNLMNDANSEVIGLRIGIKTAGCSGMKYNVEYATEIKPFEEKIVSKDICFIRSSFLSAFGKPLKSELSSIADVKK